jgi:hypothetical protein
MLLTFGLLSEALLLAILALLGALCTLNGKKKWISS